MRSMKDISLDRALKAACLQQLGLPGRYQHGKDAFWIKAIVLVQKRNLEECYCLYQQNEDGYMKLVQDFGTPSQITGIKSIHPYMYLDAEQFMPKGGLEAKRAFYKDLLGDNPQGIDVDGVDEKDLDKLLLKNAINEQLSASEAARMQNLRNEGSDLDGTNYKDVEVARFNIELEAMKRDGASKAEIAAFKNEFEHRSDDRGADNARYLSEEDKIRSEMEASDEQAHKEPQASVAGEFDVPEIDLDELRKASEEYRKEQILIAKRKWKRAHDGDRDIREGFACENEDGEQEEIETIQLPDTSEKPEQKRKPGRPKKPTKAATAKKRKPAKKSTRAARTKNAKNA